MRYEIVYEESILQQVLANLNKEGFAEVCEEIPTLVLKVDSEDS